MGRVEAVRHLGNSEFPRRWLRRTTYVPSTTGDLRLPPRRSLVPTMPAWEPLRSAVGTGRGLAVVALAPPGGGGPRRPARHLGPGVSAATRRPDRGRAGDPDLRTPSPSRSPGALWVDQQWLGQVLLHAVDAAGGWSGLAVLGAVLIGLTAGLIGLACRGRGVDVRTAAVLALGSFVVAAPTLAVRPQLFGVAGVALGLWAVATRNARPWRPWLLPAVALVLANIHGSFPIVVLIAVLVAVEDRDRRAVLVALATVAASVVTPSGPAVWAYVWDITSDPVDPDPGHRMGGSLARHRGRRARPPLGPRRGGGRMASPRPGPRDRRRVAGRVPGPRRREPASDRVVGARRPGRGRRMARRRGSNRSRPRPGWRSRSSCSSASSPSSRSRGGEVARPWTMRHPASQTRWRRSPMGHA